VGPGTLGLAGTTDRPDVNALHIVRADLTDPRHQAAVLAMTRAYAQDPMGNGRDLPEDIQRSLVAALRAHPTTLIFLALDRDEAVGIATCFIGFSTFAARPLVNIHDLHVAKDHQRKGIARRLLDAVEAEARRLGCCKLTLEVQENNRTALALYGSLGFVGRQYEPETGAVLLREKKL
jgi:ribosomal protein S18 acetylase RimI-like enzyme